MSDRCSHGMRVGTCSDCNDDHNRTVLLAERIAEHLREMLPQFRCCCTDRIGPHGVRPR